MSAIEMQAPKCIGDVIEQVREASMYCVDHYVRVCDTVLAQWSFSLSRDRAVLLALADELDKRADDILKASRAAQFTGCGPSMCEAKHDAGEWRRIARSIRKACGETERNSEDD